MRFMGGDPVVPAATDAAFSEKAADVGELPERDGHRANPEAGAEETRSEHIQPPTKRRKMPPTFGQGSSSPAVAELVKESLEEDISGQDAEVDALVAGDASGANKASAEPQGDEIELAMIEAISGDLHLVASANSEECSAEANTSTEACKLAADAQPDDKPPVADDGRETAVAAESTHEMPPGVDVGGATAKPEPRPVDLNEVAPPPEEPVVEGPSTEPRPGPPPRAALDLFPPGLPSHPTKLAPPVARLAEVLAVVNETAKPDVDDGSDGDSDMVVEPELTSPAIATELAAFIKKLATAW